MIFDFDKFDRYVKPNLFLCKPNEEIIGQISNYSDLNITPKFTDMSEISFDVYKYLNDGSITPLYDKLEKMREIFVTNFYVREESEVDTHATIRSLAQKYPTLADFGNNTIEHFYYRNPDDDNDGRPLGYFIITNIDETQNLENPVKSVTAVSCEYELSKKELHYVDGTYKMYEADNDDCLINQILTRLPKWHLNYIDSTIAGYYRTFEFGTNTIYNFLMSDFADACDAIVEFDIYNRYISIYNKDTYIAAASQYTGIVLSLNDVLDSIESSSDIEDLYTALYVPSNGDLNIVNVNPARSNTIYNFDSYMTTEWMSQGLIDALNTVKTNIAASYTDCDVTVNQTLQTSDTSDYQVVTHNTTTTTNGTSTETVTVTDCDLYKNTNGTWSSITIANCTASKPLNIMYAHESVKYVTIDSELDTLENVTLVGYEAQKAAVISSDATESAKNTQLATINGYISTTETAIVNKSAQLLAKASRRSTIISKLEDLAEDTNLEDVLTETQLNELSPFIHEGSFEDDTIIVTDSMSYVQEYEQSEELYLKAVKQLTALSKPDATFSVDVNSALFDKNFAHVTSAINTGAVIDIVDDDDNVQQYILHEISINFDSNSVDLTFGNRFYLSNPQATFADLYASTSKTGNTLNYIQSTFDFSAANEELSASEIFRTSSLDLSRNAITSSDNQQVSITDNGYIGRRVENNVTSPEQCWLVNNTLAFTDDDWETVKLALGKIPIYNSSTGTTNYYYGLNTDVLMGKILLGDKLYVGDASGDVVINGSGVTINNGKLKIASTSSSDTSLIIDTPNFTVARNGDMTCNNGTFQGDIYLTGDDSKLLIGDHGVLNHFQYQNNTTSDIYNVGWYESSGEGLIYEYYTTVNAHIPSDFYITHAYITIEHRPLYCLTGYYTGTSSTTTQTFTNQRQWARSLAVFTGSLSGPIEYEEQTSYITGGTVKGSEITAAFGSSGWTPSSTAIQTQVSGDIASSLTSGTMNKLVIGTRESEPAISTSLSTYLTNIFSKCGFINVFLDVYGYMQQ